jgi:hypothetical protein
MSDMSQGPGWWIASDGKWYPAHLHPSENVSGPSDARTGTVSATAPASATDPVSDLSDRASSEVSAVSNSAGPAVTGPPVSSGPVEPGPDDQRQPSTGTVMAAPRSSKKRRAPLAAALSVVVVIVLITSGLVFFGNGESASAKVIKAVDSTLGNRTAHVTLNVSGATSGTGVTGTGSGAIDFANDDMTLQMTVAVDGQQLPISAVYRGGVIYETVPGLDTIVPGKTWLSIDLSALQKAQQSGTGDGTIGNNPSVMLQMLAQQGNTVVALGPTTIDGVAVNGYSVTVNPSAVAEQLKKSALPLWMQQAVAGLSVHDITLKVYIDNAGLLRSFQEALTESTTASGPVTVNETLSFSDYGTPVVVTAPPASQVETFQQLLQLPGAQGTPAS